MTEETIATNEAWSAMRDRYRAQFCRLQGLADMKPPPIARERLLQLASQYRELADQAADLGGAR